MFTEGQEMIIEGQWPGQPNGFCGAAWKAFYPYMLAIHSGGNLTKWVNVAALDAATGTATAWNPDADGAVDALAVSGDVVYAGGTFATISGETRIGAAALDATGNLKSWNPPIVSGVVTLAAGGGAIYAAGHFVSVCGEDRKYLAAIDAVTGELLD